MISISTLTANINGNVVFQEDPDSILNDKTARISRTKTLDGGVFIDHRGFVDGDRTFSIMAQVTETQETILTALFEDYTSLLFVVNKEVFLGSIKSQIIDNGSLKMTVLIESKEN